MEEIIKVALLGVDFDLLKEVCDRVNSTRPTEIRYFTNLKDFLESCIEDAPDLIAVSVAFPHHSTSKFPKVFKMTLNVPILTFGENQNLKTMKLLSGAKCDLQIQGKITAQNLWIKISTLQKVNIATQKEEDSEKLNAKIANGEKSLENRGSFDDDRQSKSSLLAAVFAALDDRSSSNHVTNINSNKLIESEKYKNDRVQTNISADFFEKDRSSNSLTSNQNELVDKKKLPRELQEAKFQSASNMKETPLRIEKLSSTFQTNESQEIDLQGQIDRAMEEMFGNLGGENNPSIQKGHQRDRYGKVFLSSESGDLKTEYRKNTVNVENDNSNKRNILFESCEASAKKLYEAINHGQGVTSYRANKIGVYILESKSYKGYLLVSLLNESNDHQPDDFRKTLFEQLKSNGMTCELSKEIPINLTIDDYPRIVSEFSEFSLNLKNEQSQINISFVQREVVRPTFNQSEKEGMYTVDIKVIPPKTLVNFDAYIFLPRNNKFVRYLKNGRSLSLNQAKRFMEEMEKGKLYLPKDQRDSFIAFYIQNTLNWEFTLHKKKDAA